MERSQRRVFCAVRLQLYPDRILTKPLGVSSRLVACVLRRDNPRRCGAYGCGNAALRRWHQGLQPTALRSALAPSMTTRIGWLESKRRSTRSANKLRTTVAFSVAL
jgi:hypothetical protein